MSEVLLKSGKYDEYTSFKLSDILQREVDRLCEIMFENDDCPPTFNVSINCDKNKYKAPELYLVCNHLGMSVNRKINLYPYTKGFYDEFDLMDFMQRLYNCTM